MTVVALKFIVLLRVDDPQSFLFGKQSKMGGGKGSKELCQKGSGRVSKLKGLYI